MIRSSLTLLLFLPLLTAAVPATAGEEAPPAEPAPAAAPAPEAGPDPPPVATEPRKPGKYEAGAKKLVELGLPDTSKCKLIALTGAVWAGAEEPVWLIEEEAATSRLRIWNRYFTLQDVTKDKLGLAPAERARAYTRYTELDPKRLAAKYAKEKADQLRWRAADRFLFAAALYGRDLPEEADALIERIFGLFESGDKYERKERAEMIGEFYAELALRLWGGAMDKLGRDRDWKAAAETARGIAGRFPAWTGSTELKDVAALLDKTAARGADYLPEAAAKLPEETRKLLIELATVPQTPDLTERYPGPGRTRKKPQTASEAFAAMGLAAFPILLTVIDDDTCCLAGSSGREWEMMRYRGPGERISVPRPETRGDLAWAILREVMPRGGAEDSYRRRGRGEPSRPSAEDLRAWYEEHKAYSPEKLDLMYLTEGDIAQALAAMKKLLTADKAKHRQAVLDVVAGAEESTRLALLSELAKLDRASAIPLLREMAAGSERWTADRAKQILKSLGEKVATTPKTKEPAQDEGKDDKEGKEVDEAVPAIPPAAAPVPAPAPAPGDN
jgi:hypothetical protein